MTVSGKDRRGFVEQIRTLRTRLKRLERRNAEPAQARGGWQQSPGHPKAEDELRMRAEILENMMEGVSVSDETGTIVFTNPAFDAMFGYERGELVGQHISILSSLSEAQNSRFASQAVEHLNKHGRWSAEMLNRKKDGTPFCSFVCISTLNISGKRRWVSVQQDIAQRRKAEEALKESEEKFRSLADQSPNMIFINKRGRIVYANKKCEEVMGYAREELCSPDFDFRSLIAPESLGLIQEKFARHLRGEEVEPYDYSVINRQGQRIEAINASKLIQYEGQTAILGVVTDITERKRGERTLRESQERLKILFEWAPDAIYLTDLEGRFVDGNRAAEELVGFAKDELIGRSLAESGLLSADDLPKAAANLKKVAAGEPSGPTEYAIRRRDGGRVDVEVRTFPVRIADKVLSLGIARDVTERKKAQEAVRESEERFRGIYENALIGLYRTTPDGRILMANPALLQMLGYSSFEELAQLNLETDGYAERGRRSIFKNLVESAGHLTGLQSTWTRRDGSTLHVRESARAIRDQEGKTLYYEGTVEDISEYKRVEQKVLEYQAQLKSLTSELSLTEERERRRLATELHDQVGQSLVISKIKLDQLARSESVGELADALKDVSDCLGQVIEDTRTLTFDLSDPILYELGFEAAVAEWLTEQIQGKHGIKAEFEDDGKPKPLDDDISALLFRNVRELLINVVKHAQARHVKVLTRRAGEHIRIRVEDDGVGFDPVEGTAMAAERARFGLFSIRERLEQLGGHIEIDSEPGRGTRVTMTAPLRYDSSTGGTNR